MGILNWLEMLPLAVWVHESPSVWAQPTVLTLHTMGMGVLVGASWILDMRLLGIGKNVPLSAYRWVFRIVAGSLLVNVVTGVMLFAGRAALWGTAIPFALKMAFVIIAAGTLLPLRSYVQTAGPDDRDVNSRARWLAIVSIVAWAAAITAGRLLAYVVEGA